MAKYNQYDLNSAGDIKWADGSWKYFGKNWANPEFQEIYSKLDMSQKALLAEEAGSSELGKKFDPMDSEIIKNAIDGSVDTSSVESDSKTEEAPIAESTPSEAPSEPAVAVEAVTPEPAEEEITKETSQAATEETDTETEELSKAVEPDSATPATETPEPEPIKEEVKETPKETITDTRAKVVVRQTEPRGVVSVVTVDLRQPPKSSLKPAIEALPVCANVILTGGALHCYPKNDESWAELMDEVIDLTVEAYAEETEQVRVVTQRIGS